MPITNGYTTLEIVRRQLDIPDGSTDFDTDIELSIEAASRAIDQILGKQFYTESATKTFTAPFSSELHVPACVSVSAIVTDAALDRTYSTTLAGTDYETEGTPIHAIYITPNSTKSFPTSRNAVKVTADWGNASSAPSNIAKACELAAMRLFKRKDAVFGVVGGPAIGSAEVQTHLRADVDFMLLLQGSYSLEVY